jgi:hypothetical protein
MCFPDEGSPVRTDLARLVRTNGRISKALLPDDRPTSAFPTDVRLSAYYVHGRLHYEVSPDISVDPPERGESNKSDLLIVVQVVDEAH